MHRFGPYKLFRKLHPLGQWERWIALHERNDTDHVVYRFSQHVDSSERRRLLDVVARVSRPKHPHLLPIDAYSFDDTGHLCLVSPYTGNQEGLVPVAHLLARRAGRLDIAEVARCVEHLLEAVAHARSHGVWVESIDPDRIIIDRRGSVLYELYGLVNPRVCDAVPGPVADEIRAIGEVAAWLLTGIEPRIAPVSVARVAGRNAKAWESWIATAVDPLEGFDRIEDALASMPGRAGGSDPRPNNPEIVATPMNAVMRRFRRETTARPATPES